MIYNSLIRRILLLAPAAIFIVNAIYTIFATVSWAGILGFELQFPNGHSEIFAVYVGVWLATAALCVLATVRIQQPIFGDLAAMFLLAQPFGRILAAIQFGFPQGLLLVLFILEIVGGFGLLLVRPSKNI